MGGCVVEPQIVAWHPLNADWEEFDADVSAAYVRLLAPFMQAYPALTVDDYWQLYLSEHAALLQWLYDTGVLASQASG